MLLKNKRVNKKINFIEIKMIKLSKIINYCIYMFKKHKIYCGHNFKNYFEEIIYIVKKTLNFKINKKINYKIKIKKRKKKKIYKIIKKRTINKIPTAYLMKKIIFYNKIFYINKNTIIPRSPIGEIINNKFNIINNFNPQKILDLCTGNGCLSILCSYVYPNSIIDASDISQKALNVARKNILLHKKKNINIIKSNLFQKLKNKKYDLIICNPPYIDKRDKKYLPKEYHYEPNISLYSPQKGIYLIIKIIKNINKYLYKNGYFICEVGHQKTKIIKYFKNIKFKWIYLKNGGKGVFFIKANDLKNNFK